MLIRQCSSNILSQHLNTKHTFNSKLTQWQTAVIHNKQNAWQKLKVAPSGKIEVNKKEMLSVCLENGGHRFSSKQDLHINILNRLYYTLLNNTLSHVLLY